MDRRNMCSGDQMERGQLSKIGSRFKMFYHDVDVKKDKQSGRNPERGV